MLSNAYFLAKFRFDTAENEPAKNLQNLNFAKFANFADPNPNWSAVRLARTQHGRRAAARGVAGAGARHPQALLRRRGATSGFFQSDGLLKIWNQIQVIASQRFIFEKNEKCW